MNCISTRLLKMITCLCLAWLIGTGQNLWGQSPAAAGTGTVVTGTVLTEKGEILTGANVKASNTRSNESYSAATNQKGQFEFRNLPAGNTYNFTVSHIGYTTKFVKGFLVKPNENNSVLVRLSEGSNDLNQFVVVGYGTQKKGDLTGAVTHVRGEVLQDKPLPNISRGLQEVVPNLNSSYPLSPRTVTPKIVKDGYQWATDYANAYSAWYDYKTAPASINGAFPNTPANMDSLKQRSINPSLPKVVVDPATNKYMYFGSTDWFTQLYRNNTPAFDNALTLTGSNKNADFYISGRYYNQGGIFRYNPDNFSRYNLRMKGDINLTPWFTLSDNLDFNTYTYSYPLDNNMSPVWRNMDAATSPLSTLFNPDGSLTPGSYSSVGDLYTGNNKSNTKQIFIRNTVSFNADIIKNHLNLKGDFTYAYTNNNVTRTYIPVTYNPVPGQSGASLNNLLNQSTGTTNYYATNLYAEARQSFGDHSLKLLGGLNVEDSRYDSLFVQRDGIIDPSLPNFNLLNGINYRVASAGNEWPIMALFFLLTFPVPT